MDTELMNQVAAIKSSSQLKILGYIFTADLTQTADLNVTLSACYYRLELLKNVQNCTSPEVRSHLAKAYIFSRLQYSCISYVNLPAYQLKRIYELTMCTAIICCGNFGFRVRSTGAIELLWSTSPYLS